MFSKLRIISTFASFVIIYFFPLDFIRLPGSWLFWKSNDHRRF